MRFRISSYEHLVRARVSAEQDLENQSFQESIIHQFTDNTECPFYEHLVHARVSAWCVKTRVILCKDLLKNLTSNLLCVHGHRSQHPSSKSLCRLVGSYRAWAEGVSSLPPKLRRHTSMCQCVHQSYRCAWVYVTIYACVKVYGKCGIIKAESNSLLEVGNYSVR